MSAIKYKSAELSAQRIKADIDLKRKKKTKRYRYAKSKAKNAFTVEFFLKIFLCA